jgi:hypothetical protein
MKMHSGALIAGVYILQIIEADQSFSFGLFSPLWLNG